MGRERGACWRNSEQNYHNSFVNLNHNDQSVNYSVQNVGYSFRACPTTSMEATETAPRHTNIDASPVCLLASAEITLHTAVSPLLLTRNTEFRTFRPYCCCRGTACQPYLDFIDYHQGAGLVAKLPHCREKLRSRRHHSSFSLQPHTHNTFVDRRTEFVAQFRFDCCVWYPRRNLRISRKRREHLALPL